MSKSKTSIYERYGYSQNSGSFNGEESKVMEFYLGMMINKEASKETEVQSKVLKDSKTGGAPRAEVNEKRLCFVYVRSLYDQLLGPALVYGHK